MGPESLVSWIAPGPKSPETPGDDSIDELIKSSSDSGKFVCKNCFEIYFCFCLTEDSSNSSVEILSEDTEPPPPLRVWRIKEWFQPWPSQSSECSYYYPEGM